MQAARLLDRIVVWLRCWWFGHEQHSQDSAPPESATCMHCGDYVTYGDMDGDTRHNRTVESLPRWQREWHHPHNLWHLFGVGSTVGLERGGSGPRSAAFRAGL